MGEVVDEVPGVAGEGGPGVAGPRKGLNPFLLGLAFFLAWPLGLFLLLIHPRYGRSRGWWWAGGLWSFFMFIGWLGKGSTPDAPERSPTPQVVTARPEPSPAPIAARPAPAPIRESSIPVVKTPQPGSSDSAAEEVPKEVKSYEISKGFGRGSILIELPADRDLGIELSDLELTGSGQLNYTIVWHGIVEDGRFRVRKVQDMRWASFDERGVKLSDGDLDFGQTIRRGEPTKGKMYLGYENWKETTRIVIR